MYPLPTVAWDIRTDPGMDIRDPRASGWTCGQPPGISEREWPLDPVTGFPLQHGFTLLLPEEYRVRGAGIVAIAFFGQFPEHPEGRSSAIDNVRAIVEGTVVGEQTGDAALVAWHVAGAHKRLHRLWDMIGGAFAVIDLTQEAFEGPLCPFPKIAGLPAFADLDFPEAYEEVHAPRAIVLSARTGDPNVGIAPVEWPEDGCAYESIFDAAYNYKPWMKGFSLDHIGGSATPIQGYPDLSPFYIEFEEGFGRFNFGGGSAQLCLQHLVFDWACG